MTINQSIKLFYSAPKSWPESWPTCLPHLEINKTEKIELKRKTDKQISLEQFEAMGSS